MNNCNLNLNRNLNLNTALGIKLIRYWMLDKNAQFEKVMIFSQYSFYIACPP